MARASEVKPLSRPNYLFLIAVGRSGTTALRKSLWQHPSICYNGRENNVLTDVVETALLNCTKPDRKNAMTVSQEVYNCAFERAVNEILWNGYDPACGQIRMASFAMFSNLSEYLLQMFPKARILHLVRNGIEVVASRQLFAHFHNMPFQDHCERWARTLEWYEWGQQHPETYRLVRYEWFGDEKILREKLAELYEWLAIPWQDAPLEHLLNERYHPTQHPSEKNALDVQAAQTSPEGREQLEQARNQRWQFWDEEQRATFEKICGDAMQRFGYPIQWQALPNAAIPQANLLSQRVRQVIDKTRNLITIQTR